MIPATTTTISGVTILAKKRSRRPDVFDITLSHEGIDIKRPGRNEQRLSWDRISQWEIAEHVGYLVLTLRGDGAVTPLVVKGWTLDDLEVVIRDVTTGVTGPIPARTMPPVPVPPSLAAEPETADPEVIAPEAIAPEAIAPETAAPETPAPEAMVLDTVVPQANAAPAAAVPPAEPRAARRERAKRGRTARVGWKTVVTVVMLGALATAVVLVLLQSAGVISWGFLGPTA